MWLIVAKYIKCGRYSVVVNVDEVEGDNGDGGSDEAVGVDLM